MAQNSRRGRSGRRRQGGGGNNPNRSMDSQGPEVKIRGNAQQVYDKYTALARDAFSAGDRVRGESLQQHAEHYYRLLQAMQPDKKPEQQDQAQGGGGQNDAPRAASKDEQAARDGQGRRQNKDREEGDIAARASDEPARMDGAEQAATDDAQGSGAQGSGQDAAEAAEEAPKRRRRRRTRRDEADGDDQGEAGGKGSNDASAKDTEAAAKAPEEAPA